MRKNKFLIPENLDIDSIINKNPLEFFGQSLKKEKLLFICDAIIKARATQRKQMNENKTWFINVCSQYLDQVVDNYNLYLDFLIKSGVINTDNHFIKGEKCRGYYFNPPFAGQPLKQLEIKNFALKNRIRKANENRIKERKAELWGYSYLTKWLDDKKLEINEDAAIEWIENYTLQKIKKINNEISLKNKGAKLIRAIDTCEDFKNIIERINSGDYHYSFSGDAHRFYNVLTNLKKELREFLTYDGQQLVNIDIKSSQPYMVIALFNPEFWKTQSFKEEDYIGLSNIDKEVYKNIRRSKEYNNIITLLLSSKTQDDTVSPFQKYIDLIIGQGLYEYIQKHFHPTHGQRFDDRQKVKKEVLRIMYCEPNDDRKDFYKPCITFSKHFPQVYSLFKSIKSVAYTFLPLILQKLESILVIDIICKKISKINPDIPLFTIHDSILTTQGNEGLVEEIMKEELEKYIGVMPNVERQYLGSKILAA